MAQDEREKAFYGKDKSVYDENKSKVIQRKQSMKRTEATWENGNVVIVTF